MQHERRFGVYEVAVHSASNSHRALITLGGIGDMATGHIPFEFQHTAQQALPNVHGIFIRDTARSWYNHPEGWAELVAHLKQYLAQHHISEVTLMGLSMGGFGALVLSLYLPATQVVALSSRTRLLKKPHFDHRNIELVRAIPAIAHQNPLKHLNPATRYTLVFSIDEKEDTVHAGRGLKHSVQLLATRGDHNIGHALQVENKLEDFVKTIVMEGSAALSERDFGFFTPAFEHFWLAAAALDGYSQAALHAKAQALPQECWPSYLAPPV